MMVAGGSKVALEDGLRAQAEAKEKAFSISSVVRETAASRLRSQCVAANRYSSFVGQFCMSLW